MRTYTLVTMILLASILIGCIPLLPPGQGTTLTIPPKQPEPSHPRIGGEISDGPDGTLVTIYIRTPAGRDAHTVKGPFPGLWEAVVTEASGLDYVITAEAEGYLSQPISYTIHISGDTAYVVRDGHVSDEEAIHIDFHFVPKDSP